MDVDHRFLGWVLSVHLLKLNAKSCPHVSTNQKVKIAKYDLPIINGEKIDDIIPGAQTEETKTCPLSNTSGPHTSIASPIWKLNKMTIRGIKSYKSTRTKGREA